MTPEQEKRLFDFVDQSLMFQGKMIAAQDAQHGHILAVSSNVKKLEERVNAHEAGHTTAALDDAKEARGNGWQLITVVLSIAGLLVAGLALSRGATPMASARRVDAVSR